MRSVGHYQILYVTVIYVVCIETVHFPIQSSYSNVVIREGSEPENFFWVALGGKAEYETVRRVFGRE